MRLPTIKMSFYITYVLLLTTGVITFIEAIRTKLPMVRHIMNLETCISIVAAYFYSQFVLSIEKSTIDYGHINTVRYTDWFITTPMMLLALCLVLSYNIGTSLNVWLFASILLLNFIMLWLGYQGDTGGIPKARAWALSFLAFWVMFGVIGYVFVFGRGFLANTILFALYVGLWSMYGFAYFLEESQKTVLYNALDATAKCLVGLILWAYYTKIVVV
jgi:bacteriorhodopsin